MKPTLSYFVCATARSGSSLLCDLLGQTGVAGYPGEYFTPVNYGEAAQAWGLTEAPFSEFLKKTIEKSTTPNGVFGTKMFIYNIRQSRFRELPEFAGRSLPPWELMPEIFPNLHYIWIMRRNKIRQAVSYLRAKQTMQWETYKDDPRRPKETPVYDRDQIQWLLEEAIMEEVRWQEHFKRANVQPLTIVYEDFVAQKEETIRRVLDYLGIEAPAHRLNGRPKLIRQADELSDQWVERFFADKQW